MTIKPGDDWGRRAGDAAGAIRTGSDAELAVHVAAGEIGPFAVEGGDLHRSLGAPRPGAYSLIVPIDALVVRLDGGVARLAVAHVVVRRGWWRGRLVAICNADHLGEWNVAPRAHPNDGRADVVDVASTMALRARWQARQRLPQGTHVPHPAITTRSVKEAAFEFDRPHGVWLDGVRVGSAERLSVTVQADAFELYV